MTRHGEEHDGVDYAYRVVAGLEALASLPLPPTDAIAGVRAGHRTARALYVALQKAARDGPVYSYAAGAEVRVRGFCTLDRGSGVWVRHTVRTTAGFDVQVSWPDEYDGAQSVRGGVRLTIVPRGA